MRVGAQARKRPGQMRHLVHSLEGLSFTSLKSEMQSIYCYFSKICQDPTSDMGLLLKTSLISSPQSSETSPALQVQLALPKSKMNSIYLGALKGG